MIVTSVLTGLGACTVLLAAATRVPPALAELLRACLPLAAACADLRAAFTRDAPPAE